MATIILLLRLHETGSLRPVIRYSLFAGITLGLAHVLRPVAMVIIPTIVLYLKWCTNWFNLHKSRLVSFTLSFIVGLLITIRAIMGLASDVVNLPLSSTSAGFSLYEGTTINSRGCWSEEHGRILEDFAYRPDDIHKASYQRAWSNVSTDPLGFIQLIGTKFVLFWGSDDYGVFFSTTEQSPTESSMIIHMYRYHLNLLSNGAYIFLIVLAAIGLYLHRTTENKTLFIVQSVFLLHVAAYSILEIQSRYHFLVVPLLMIPAAMALASSKNNDLPV
jgi:hypothetical protein